MKQLSDKQREIYNYIRVVSHESGYPPSIREIAAAVGLSSPSTVQSHINRLISLGYLVREEGKTRTLKVAGQGHSVSVPVIGTVAAGSPILAVESIEGYISYSPTHPGGEYFALAVRGDSMINAGIFDGDTVIVRRQQAAGNNEIVVALIGEEATVKRLRLEDGKAFLMPENPAYGPIDGSNAVILGRVVALMRDY